MKVFRFAPAASILALLVAPASALACQNGIPPQNPDHIYIVHDDGTVTDTRTSLMWKRCSEGQNWTGATCSGTATELTWPEAVNAASASDYAGYSDWRLPNVKELGSLVETCRTMPAINVTMFPNTPMTPNPSYWTSSPTPGIPSAWFMGFDLGYSLRSGRSGRVKQRLVRDADQQVGSW